MTCAAIPSLKACRDTQRRVEVRHRWHDLFDHWLNHLEDRMKDRTRPLEASTPAGFGLRQGSARAVTEGLVEPSHRATLERHTAACPQCGQRWSAWRLELSVSGVARFQNSTTTRPLAPGCCLMWQG